MNGVLIGRGRNNVGELAVHKVISITHFDLILSVEFPFPPWNKSKGILHYLGMVNVYAYIDK